MFTLPAIRHRPVPRRSALARRARALACAGALLGAGTASSDLLPDWPEQRVRPGTVLELDVRTESPDASVFIERAPVDAVLEPLEPGRWTLRWPTPRRHEGRTVIRLGAVDRADRSRRDSREIVVVRSARPDAVPEVAGVPVQPASSSSSSSEEVSGELPLLLPDIAPLRLVPGRAWELRIAALDGARGPRAAVTMRVVGAPAGLGVVPVEDGWHALRWRPADAQAGTHAFELVATDIDDRTRRASRRLVLAVSSEPGVSTGTRGAAPELVEVPAVNRPDADPARASVREREPRAASAAAPVAPFADGLAAVPMAAPVAEPPRLRPLSNQVVSAGKAVAFKVRTSDPDGRERAVVRIDRLPRNASFDENPDGSRTFHWPTSDRDQGEHRFRITAANPVDPSLVDSTDVLVVVGDPSRGRTVPAGDPVRP